MGLLSRELNLSWWLTYIALTSLQLESNKTLVSVRCGVLVSLEQLCYKSWGLQYTFNTLFPKLLQYRSGLRVSKTFIMALNKRMEVGTCLSL